MNRYIAPLDNYADNLELFLSHHAVLAPLLLLLAEEMGLPILVPGDAIIGYVGYSLTRTHAATFVEAFIVAMFAVLLGASILFYLAKRYGNGLLRKIARYIFLQEKHLEKAETLFAKYGIWAIIFGRHVPGLRVPITILAATSGVKYRTFLLCTIASTTLWVLFYLSIGKSLGNDIQHTIHKYVWLSVGIIVATLVVTVGLHIYGTYRERTRTKTKR